ncbi:glycoside hydrolase family 73 protein [Paenibacillus sp. FA6]|uniref:glycoside hydrolase family 73 protein n=1 Tax=Paenibacillus sp. FA6 TaxID=3413029 RepID=UPI003F657C20
MSRQYTQSAFFVLLAPIVVKVRSEGSKMLPSVRLAQNWLETGGKIHDWNNLGGYKVGNGSTNAYWKGKSVSTSTWEVYDGRSVTTTANWRVYDSIYDFYKDQDLLFAKTRYARVRAATTPELQTAALYACGYATDPNYASKLMSIIKANDLTKYDTLSKEDEEMTKEEKAIFITLQTTVKTQAKQIADLERRLNLSGKETYAIHYAEAVNAAKAAGAITTSEDKSKIELNMIQMLHNLGLFKKVGQ